MYALVRLQAEKRTWYWAVQFTRKGKQYSKRFYDPMHGGSIKAKDAAVAWRDAQLAKTPVLTKLEFCRKIRSTNTSGVTGVSFLSPARQPGGIWQARLKLDGKVRVRNFTVMKYGYDKAFEMAVAAREVLLETVEGVFLKHPVAFQMALRHDTSVP